MSFQRLTLWAGVLALLATANPAAAVKVLAFGDSVTAGVGDEDGIGYPGRLEQKLEDDSEVLNLGEPAEETALGLTRLPAALANGGDVLLLMEGTNDVTRIAQAELSIESTLANLDMMITKTRQADIEPVLTSVIPRSPQAKRDRTNEITRFFVGELRELAIERNVRFTDAYDLFDPETVPEFFDDYYDPSKDDVVGHPNAAGYEKLAEAFADLLNEVDSQPPVIGNFEPGPLPNFIPGNTRITVPVYDFKKSSGLDLDETKLLINGTVVTTGAESNGDSKKVELSHQGRKALGCRAVIQVQARDRAEPPNQFDRVLALYGIEGRTVRVGDVNFDCDVDGVDLVQVALRFGLESSDPGYAMVWDLNNDELIDQADIDLLLGNFGKTSLE